MPKNDHDTTADSASHDVTLKDETGDTQITVSSPVKSSDEVSAMLKSDFDKLRAICNETVTTICSHISVPFNMITTDKVSRSQKVSKPLLFEHLKKLVKHCNRMCERDSKIPAYDNDPQLATPVAAENSDVKHYFSKVEASLFNVEASVTSHNGQMLSILTQLANLQSDVSKISNGPCPTSVTRTTGHELPAYRHPPESTAAPQHPKHPATPKEVKQFEERVLPFLDTETYDELASFLTGCTFTGENGHSVAAYGERYHYSGAQAKTAPTTELPPVLAKVMKSVGEQCKYQINSVLINHYAAGDDSYLPEHSDNESSIDPESFICTLSIGATRTLTFKEICTGDETTLNAEDNSLYHMSRNSQNFFTHRIDKTTGAGERYSLTFRCVGMKFRRSTIIIGHSQTEDFAFGDGKGTFGRGLPGKRVKAGHVKDIRPTDCMSYANVVILCGINDLREGRYTKTGDIDVNKTFSIFKDKISEICRIKKNINVFICPILPSKSYIYHARAVKFNKLIYSEIIDQGYYRCSILNVSSFCDSSYRSDLLDSSYSRGDLVHLNARGTRKLATLIKDSIFRKYNSGKGSRIDSVKPYSAALQDGPPGSGTPNPS